MYFSEMILDICTNLQYSSYKLPFVTFQEWPGEIYPPYADGPGYIVSSDIAQFIVTEFEKNRLRVCQTIYTISSAQVLTFLY